MPREPDCKHTTYALTILDLFAAEKFTMEDGLLVIAILLEAATADEPPEIARRVIEDIANAAHANVAKRTRQPLINSAPELLAALKGLLGHCGIADAASEDKDPEDHELERMARAVIAKAEGGA